MDLRIAALHFYPIKGCAGTSANSVILEDLGFAYDRRWMVVREGDGRFVTQRDCPVMACIRPVIEGNVLSVTAPDRFELRIRFGQDGETRSERAVTVWKFDGVACDEGDDVARWFSAALGFACRLVRTGPHWTRTAGKDAGSANPPRVGFADGYAVLLASESSLADLNRRLNVPVPMERFRANIIVAGGELTPWAEDGWSSIRLPLCDRTLQIAKPCARCSVTTIDQSTGTTTGSEPLRTLSTFRRMDENKVMFGSNLIYDSLQPDVKISVGDPIVPIVRK